MLSCFRLHHKICYKEKKNLFFILKITKKKNILKALYFLFLRIKIVFLFITKYIFLLSCSIVRIWSNSILGF